MENQINVENQNTQQIGQNAINQPVPVPEKPKRNYLMIGGIVLVCFAVFGIGGYYLGAKQWSTSNSMPSTTIYFRFAKIKNRAQKIKKAEARGSRAGAKSEPRVAGRANNFL